MSNLAEKAAALMKKEQLLAPQGTVVVGLSGGADSVALTHFLQMYLREQENRLVCVHVHHGLRGGEADRDEAFVRAFCRERGLALRVYHVNIEKEAAASGEGLEECGRRFRYRIFSRLAENPQDRIAVAHTLSDQMETMLMHMARGCSVGALAGMHPKRGKIIRPLLEVTRQEVEDYCREQGLAFCVDTTNLSPLYARNRIRLHAVPALRELNPQAEAAFGRVSRQLRREDAFLSRLTREALDGTRTAFGYRVQALAMLDEALLLRCLSHMFREKTEIMPEEKHLREAAVCIRQGAGSVPFPGRWCFCCDGGTARFYRPAPSVPFWVKKGEDGCFSLPDRRRFFCRRIALPETGNEKKFHNLLFNNGFDYATIAGDLILRSRRPGDRFCPIGKMEKPLNRWLSETGIPREERDQLAILCSEDRILWVQGLGTADFCRVTEKTAVAGVLVPAGIDTEK